MQTTAIPEQSRHLAAVLASSPASTPAGIELTTIGGFVIAHSGLSASDRSAFAALDKVDPSWLAAALSRHDEVVRELHAERAVFPMQFGTVVPAIALITPLLSAHGDELARYFDQVADCDEFAVRFLVAKQRAALDTGGGSGADYLRRRAAAPRDEERQAEGRQAQMASVVETLKALARDHQALTGRDELPVAGGRETLGKHAFLVPRAAASDFQARVEASQTDFDGVEVACTGPWAPYSFRPRLAL
ncbi:MAG: GvpL/GvpF family gas vesicle protein [Pseudomonadota bacterium]